MDRKNCVLFAITAGIFSLGLVGVAACSLPMNPAKILGSKGIETSPGITVVATSEPEQYLTPDEYIQNSQHLAVAVTYLNMAESILLLDLPTAEIPQIDSDLVEFARRADDVATQAESLAKTSAQYLDNPSMEDVAGQYSSIARLGYVMVIQANNLRQGLANGSISREQAAETIEQYKPMLWNPKVDELTPGQSTFLPEGSAAFLSPEVVTQVSADTQLKTWLASTQDQVTLELDLSVLDKALLPNYAGLSEAERANTATFYRAIDLLSTYKEDPSDASPNKARVEVLQGVTITEAGAELPTYAAGKASLLGKDISGNIGESQAAGSLLHFGLNGDKSSNPNRLNTFKGGRTRCNP